MSKNLVGEHSSNQHENDFFHTTEVGSARIKDSESNPNEFRLIIDKEDADALSFFFKDEAGNEGNHSLEDFTKIIEKQGGEQDGVISYKQANGDEDGLIFKFDSESFDVNDNGDLVITGQRKSLKASDASKKYFDEDDIFGEDYLRLHRQHHKEGFEGSEKIQDISLTTDTFSQRDWVDAEKDYHYNVTKDILDTIFTSPEYREKIENELDNKGKGLRNELVANGNISLDERAELGGLNWFSIAAMTLINPGVQRSNGNVGTYVKNHFYDPITNPETWKAVGGVTKAVGSWSESFFNNEVYPALTQGIDWTRNAFFNWMPTFGATDMTAEISDLPGKEWSIGGTNISLSLSADVKANVGYTLPQGIYQLLNGSFGELEFSLAVPITAVFKGSVTPDNPLTVPLAYNEVSGPVARIGSGFTVTGGMVKTKAKYGLDGFARGGHKDKNLGFEFFAGITPVVTLSAKKSGVTPSARIEDRYFRKSYTKNFDQITDLELKAYVTPELNISGGFYVPAYVPLVGSKKLAAVESTLSMPLTFGVKSELQDDYSIKNFATVGAGVDYSIDAEFLERIYTLGFNLANGNIASWDNSMTL